MTRLVSCLNISLWSAIGQNRTNYQLLLHFLILFPANSTYINNFKGQKAVYNTLFVYFVFYTEISMLLVTLRL